jgi:cation diffusion facilitator family transporter
MARDRIVREDYTSSVRRVLIYTLILNSAVALAKALYGYMTNSIAMTSDGLHSFMDGISNVIGLIGIWIASHPPDRDHPYGHRKYETLFTTIIGLMIFATCFQILRRIYISFQEDHRTLVTGTSFAIMACTMAVNVFVMKYESKKGKQIGSGFLVADAKHTRSDIIVSLSVIIGLIFTKLGYAYADTVIGFVIAVLIGKIGYDILKSASDVLVDTMCLDNSAIESVVIGVEGVKGCHDIRARGTENEVYLDFHILVDGNMPIQEAHDIADLVERRIKDEFPSVVDVMVHIEPGPARNRADNM